MFTSSLNSSLRETELTFTGFTAQVDFSKDASVSYCTGICTENGLIEVPEDSDLDIADQVPSFTGAIADVFSENEYSAAIM